MFLRIDKILLNIWILHRVEKSEEGILSPFAESEGLYPQGFGKFILPFLALIKGDYIRRAVLTIALNFHRTMT